MMYRVRWMRVALDELALLWTAANSEMRQASSQAVDRIDYELARDAPNKGESRDEGKRILLAFPLGVRFQVDEVSKTVQVLHVWSYRKRG